LLGFVRVGGEERDFGRERADVTVTVVADSAKTHRGFIAAIARAEDVFLFRGHLGTEERGPLHLRGNGRAREAQQGRGHVDGLEQPAIHGAGAIVGRCRQSFRPADNQRHAQPLLVAELFATDVGLAVVAHEDHHGVVSEALLFEPGKDLGNLAVQPARRVEIVGVVLPDDGMIGIPAIPVLKANCFETFTD